MKARSALLLAAAGLGPLLAAFWGAPGPLLVGLNLGPGDGPYLSGFWPEYEIAQGTALHWSRPEAVLALPLAFSGPAELSLRFGPPPGGPSRVEMVLGDRPLGGFDCCRHRALQRQRLDATVGPRPTVSESSAPSAPPVRSRTPVRIGLRVKGDDVRDRGLYLDRVDLDLGKGARVYLAGAARFRGAVLVGLALVVLGCAGFAWQRAALLIAPLAAILTFGLLVDPWLVHRLLWGVPEALALLVPLVLLGRFARERLALGREDPLAAADFRFGIALFLAVALPRAILVNHPDYYYPDLMIHTRIAKLMGREGLEFLARPDLFLGRFQEARNSIAGYPYSIAFHVPLALWNPAYDTALCALRVGGAFLSALPVLLGALLLRRLHLSTFGVFLLAVAPTYPHWLFHATLPALFGHAFDLLLITWLVSRLEDLGRTRTFLAGALLVAAAQLAYAYGLPVTALLVGFLALFLALRDDGGRALALRTLLMGALGAALALAVYYRHFVAGAWAAAQGVAPTPLVAGAMAGPPVTPGAAALLPFADAARFFDALWPLLAFAGLVALWRDSRSIVFRAYVATVIALVAARAFLPGIFRWNHELLLLTPLLCLLAGEALGRLAARGRGGRMAAWLLLGVLAIQALTVTARSFLKELNHAR